MLSELFKRCPLSEYTAFRLVSADSLTIDDLHQGEKQVIEGITSPKRRLHFALGRKAARMALKDLGIEGPVLKGKDGAPLWPKGVVGSIAHTRNVAVCVAGKAKNLRAIGIDIEKASVNPKIGRRICTESEYNWANKGKLSLRLAQIFSAKEALYKALYPITDLHLNYRDVALLWDEDLELFKATFPKHLSPILDLGEDIPVHCLKIEDLLLTAVFIGHPDPKKGK